jgi:hypothetical protein
MIFGLAIPPRAVSSPRRHGPVPCNALLVSRSVTRRNVATRAALRCVVRAVRPSCTARSNARFSLSFVLLFLTHVRTVCVPVPVWEEIKSKKKRRRNKLAPVSTSRLGRVRSRTLQADEPSLFSTDRRGS